MLVPIGGLLMTFCCFKRIGGPIILGMLSERDKQPFRFEEPMLSELVDLWLQTGLDWLKFSKEFPNVAEAMGTGINIR